MWLKKGTNDNKSALDQVMARHSLNDRPNELTDGKGILLVNNMIYIVRYHSVVDNIIS